MKNVLYILALTVSTAAFSQQLGEGAKLDCNSDNWTCDSQCQANKARACGLNIDEINAKRDLASQKPRSARGAQTTRN